MLDFRRLVTQIRLEVFRVSPLLCDRCARIVSVISFCYITINLTSHVICQELGVPSHRTKHSDCAKQQIRANTVFSTHVPCRVVAMPSRAV